MICCRKISIDPMFLAVATPVGPRTDGAIVGVQFSGQGGGYPLARSAVERPEPECASGRAVSSPRSLGVRRLVIERAQLGQPLGDALLQAALHRLVERCGAMPSGQ